MQDNSSSPIDPDREDEELNRRPRERDEQENPDEVARNAWELTAEDLANAVPALPFIEQCIRRLEGR